MARRAFENEVAAERANRETLKAELARVQRAALSRAEREAAVDQYLASQSATLDLRLLNLFGDRHSPLEYSSGGTTTSLVPIFVALMRPKLRDLLLEYGDQDAKARGLELHSTVRDQKIAELEAEILESERREEFAIRDAATQGVRIRRRGDASPAAVLAKRPEPLAAA